MREKCSNTKFSWSVIFCSAFGQNMERYCVCLGYFSRSDIASHYKKRSSRKKTIKVMKKVIRSPMENMSASTDFFLL